jgi:hypothetical protein
MLTKRTHSRSLPLREAGGTLAAIILDNRKKKVSLILSNDTIDETTL